MNPYSQTDLDSYLKDDFILTGLKKFPDDESYVSHRWLQEMPVKRMIYADVYGDLLRSSGLRVLDIGGGFCGLSRYLIDNHDYTLIDIMAHDSHDSLSKVELDNKKFWFNGDWLTFEPTGTYDVIIANDIFPNVDQRLNLFLNKFKPHAKKIIVTLTCNDYDRFYVVKRVDAEEILTMVAWTRDITSLVVSNFMGKKINLLKSDDGGSLFKNGRLVYKFIV